MVPSVVFDRMASDDESRMAWKRRDRAAAARTSVTQEATRTVSRRSLPHPQPGEPALEHLLRAVREDAAHLVGPDVGRVRAVRVRRPGVRHEVEHVRPERPVGRHVEQAARRLVPGRHPSVRSVHHDTLVEEVQHRAFRAQRGRPRRDRQRRRLSDTSRWVATTPVSGDTEATFTRSLEPPAAGSGRGDLDDDGARHRRDLLGQSPGGLEPLDVGGTTRSAAGVRSARRTTVRRTAVHSPRRTRPGRAARTGLPGQHVHQEVGRHQVLERRTAPRRSSATSDGTSPVAMAARGRHRPRRGR